jgi:hypothetical protein
MLLFIDYLFQHMRTLFSIRYYLQMSPIDHHCGHLSFFLSSNNLQAGGSGAPHFILAMFV